eukprot:g3242.t1
MTWSELSEDVYDILSFHLDRRQLQSLHLLNRHFRRMVSSRLKLLTPRQISLEIPFPFTKIHQLDLSRCWNEVNDTTIISLTKRLSRSTVKLQHLSLSRCHGVTNRGIAAIADHLNQLVSLNLSGCRSPSPIDRVGYSGVNGETLIGLNKLTTLYLRWNPVTDASFEIIARITGLTELDLGECHGLSGRGLIGLKSFHKTMQKLSLERTMVGIEAIQEIVKYKNLHTLNLRNCSEIDDFCLLFLSHVTTLTTLNVSKLYNITDDGVRHLMQLPNLTSLDLSYCTRLGGNWISSSSSSVHLKLTELKLADCCSWVTDEILKTVTECVPKLKILKLENCVQLTSEGLAALTRLDLVDLDLSFCVGVHDDDLKLISKINSLEHLNLAFCSLITDDGMKHLASLNKLKTLILDCCCHISSCGISRLKPLKNSLTSLDIAACHGVSPEAIPLISECFYYLENLNLSWLSVTNEQFRSLKKLKNLSKIEIRGCHELTQEVLREFWYLDGVSCEIP